MTIGQTTFTAQDIAAPSGSRLGGVGGVAFANNTLFVVDSNKVAATPLQNRVLIYNNVSSFILPPTSEIPQGLRCPVCIGPDQSGAGPSVVVGQPDFVTTTTPNITQNGFQTPTGVATDGNTLVVADTDNNRVLIWKTIPTANHANADVVLGQPNFTTANPPPQQPTASSLRGPQGVWVQGGRLFVADTQNHRVLVWNSIPTANNQAADYVLGEPSLTTAPPITASDIPPQANNLFSPVAVTSDGQRLLVTDLAHNRVLIWNSIPTTSQAPADVEVGQPDMVSEVANNVLGACVASGTDSDNNPTFPSGCTSFCPSTGVDSDSNPTYPQMCGRTLNFPRYALSDGQRLYIADGGNDRILVYNSIPTQNGQKADEILGQVDEFTDQVSDSSITTSPVANILSSSPDTIRTPLALAWDGTNLYAADPYDRRVLVYTPGQSLIPINGVTNAASLVVYAIGTVVFGGTITSGDVITVTISGKAYTYTVTANDNLGTITTNVLNVIKSANSGAGDPNILVTSNPGFNELVLTARVAGSAGDNITLAATVTAASSTATATETATGSGAVLTGGSNAAQVAPGTLLTINGTDLSDNTAIGTPDSQGYYPSDLGGVEVYFDGIKAPLFYVSPTQINTQVPFEVSGSNGVTSFVRTAHSDGSVTATTSISVPIVPSNPGIFAEPGPDPRTGIVYHTSGNAIAIVSVDGSILANDVATVTIENRSYSYTIEATDSLTTIRDGLIELINANADEKVVASPSGQFTRIVLTAKVAGPDGDGIPISTSSSPTSALIILSVLNSPPATCCASVAGTRVTADNPAVPGEVLTLYAAGIGLATLADGTTPAGATGQIYNGPVFNIPVNSVDNAQLGLTTANVLNAGLLPGTAGVYQVTFQISSTLPTDPNTHLFIAQSVFTSNIVTIPVQAP